MKSQIEKRYAVLISPCILSPGLQVVKKSGVHWGYSFIQFLMEMSIDIIPLPCPESTFNGYQFGLQRNKHGLDYYKSLDGYKTYCKNLAIQSANMIVDMHHGGYCFICFLGIEHSPTCAINYIYSNHGMLNCAGIFSEHLSEELKMRGFEIPQIGINRTYPKKALSFLQQLVSDINSEKGDIF